jgi:hypothetical protein
MAPYALLRAYLDPPDAPLLAASTAGDERPLLRLVSGAPF